VYESLRHKLRNKLQKYIIAALLFYNISTTCIVKHTLYYKAYKILTLSITQVACERAFSKLKQVANITFLNSKININEFIAFLIVFYTIIMSVIFFQVKTVYRNSMIQNNLEAFILMATEKKNLSDISYQTVIYPVLDLAKLKKGDSIYFKKKNVPKTG
jgi:hypothetical protein